MSLNENRVCYERTKTAQGRNETKLSHLFAQIQVEVDRAKVKIAMGFREGVFDRQSRDSEKSQAEDDDDTAYHNSFRKNRDQASNR
jgi:hypothetical protein